MNPNNKVQALNDLQLQNKNHKQTKKKKFKMIKDLDLLIETRYSKGSNFH